MKADFKTFAIAVAAIIVVGVAVGVMDDAGILTRATRLFKRGYGG